MRRRYAVAAALLGVAAIGLTPPTFGDRTDIGPIADYLQEVAAVSLPRLDADDHLRPALEQLADARPTCDALLPALDAAAPAVARVRAELAAADVDAVPADAAFLGPVITQLDVQGEALRDGCP